MTFRTLIRRSLRFHWRAHLGVVLGATVGSAALIGAFVVGDSVRESLKQRALQRLGSIHFALEAGDRTITDSLAGRMPRDLMDSWREDEGYTWVYFSGGPAAALVLPGVATTPDGTARANRVQVIGVAQTPEAERGNHYYEFWSYSESGSRPELPRGKVLLNATLAAQLKVAVGDEVIVRVPKPAALSPEVAVTARGEDSVPLRLSVAGILASRKLGDFNLRATATPVPNAFVNLAEFQQVTQRSSRANLLVSGGIMVDPERTPMRVSKIISPLLGREVAERIASWFRSTHLRDAAVAQAEFQEALRESATLADYEASLRASPAAPTVDLVSSRVFLDPPVARSAMDAETNSRPLLTYLANLMTAGMNITPYSMVTAAGAPWTPADMRDNEILVSQWLAEDLQVKPGDEIVLSYFAPESGPRLIERTNTFRVRGVVQMEMPWADRTLMPDFPGIEKAESTSDWDAGFPLTYKIRQKDEDYWKKYRGTPKAFITLAAGQKMWANRFGNLTAIRFPVPTNAASTLTPALSPGERENRSPIQSKTDTAGHSNTLKQTESGRRLFPLPAGEGQGEGERPANTNQFETPHVVTYKEALEKKILGNLKPEELGLRFEPVREQALKAAEGSQDFGGLFLGFSFFVIAAALLLMALLFSLGLEQRAPEIGTLLALGFTPKQVRNLLLREGVMLSLLGGILGSLGGLAYAKTMLHGLTTVWRDAVGTSALGFHFTGQTLIIGLFASVVVSVVTIWVTMRKIIRRPARELLVGEIGSAESGPKTLKAKVISIAALLLALGLVGWAVGKGDTSNAGVFFGAGSLVLLAGLAAANAGLIRLGGSDVSTPALSLREREDRSPISVVTETVDGSRAQDKSESGRVLSPLPAGEGQGEGERRDVLSLTALGLRGCARRRKRSLSTIAMLACGSFLIVSIGVFRLDANRNAWKKTSGTGGYALIGETTMPVVHDLNTISGQSFFALNERDLQGVSFVPFRVRAGDEASCLNLNAAQRPKLLGVKPELLEGRFGFSKGEGWAGLRSVQPDAIPAIGDANSIQWAMKKNIGDTIDYVDERGQPFKVRIVGAVANSILQGQLIIDEAEFVKRFPGESGYRMFLIDAPSNNVPQVSAMLSRAMQDVGLELTPTAERLAQFNAVQNTYLGTFQVLGGLGLLLGSVGLGIVVLRNVLERRGELAVLLAVGFRKPQLQRLLLIENGALLGAGLVLGIVAAVVAVLPALLSPSAQLPLASLALTLVAVLINGGLWTWAATRFAVRGDLLKALRNE